MAIEAIIALLGTYSWMIILFLRFLSRKSIYNLNTSHTKTIKVIEDNLNVEIEGLKRLLTIAEKKLTKLTLDEAHRIDKIKDLVRK